MTGPGARSDAPVVEAFGLTRVYPRPGGDVVACRDVTAAVHAGDFVVVRGRSGAGKTTLLHLLGGLDRPTAGRVHLAGQDPALLSDAALAHLRRTQLGFVFQSFGLLPTLTAAENVEVPLRIGRVSVAERTRRVAEALDRVGLGGAAAQRPRELSGGQQQRVGIARALVGRPRILFADEPTAQLDATTAAGVLDVLAHLVARDGVTAIVTTHAESVAARASRRWTIRDGRVTEEAPGVPPVPEVS